MLWPDGGVSGVVDWLGICVTKRVEKLKLVPNTAITIVGILANRAHAVPLLWKILLRPKVDNIDC